MAVSGEELRLFAPEVVDAAAAPVVERVRLRLLVAYHGAAFHGIAPQPRSRTVGGVLIEAVGKVLRQPTPPLFTCAGRTDTGVHGWGQVVHLDVVPTWASGPDPAHPGQAFDAIGLARRLNRMLAPEVVVRRAEVAPPGFDARHSALWRRYRYYLLAGSTPDPFTAATQWHVGSSLSLDAMRLGCDPFLGDHDFTSFCRVPRDQDNPSMVRTLLDAHFHPPDGNRITFEVSATSFCQHMVRAMVGFLVEIGRGKRTAGDVREVIAARSRQRAASIAPPHGLVLWEVGYPAAMDWAKDPVLGHATLTTP